METSRDLLPYQEGVLHGPYLPLSEVDAVLISVESQRTRTPSTLDVIQQEHQLFFHADSIFWSWRKGYINDLSHYWMKENCKDALNSLPILSKP